MTVSEHHPHFATKFSAIPPEEIEPSFWRNKAKSVLEDKLKQDHNLNVAKNIIFFIGDGMDTNTVAATRMYNGGEATALSFETFPNYGLSNVRIKLTVRGLLL